MRNSAMRQSRQLSYSPLRYRIVMGCFAIGLLILAARLGQIQVAQHAHYTARADSQYGITRELFATRGTINSSDGFELAGTQPAYLIYADPKRVDDPHKTARTIVDILNQPSQTPQVEGAAPAPQDTQVEYQYQQILDKLLLVKRDWIAIASKIDQSKVDQLKQQNLAGIDFESQQRRYYPEGSLASQILGFVAQNDQGQDQGYYGIEGYFDRDLRGVNGKTVYDRDPSGNPIPVGDYSSQPAQDGKNITLTINRSLQYITEQRLKEGVEKYGAEAGSVIIMEPSTGRIITMANYPTFDPRQVGSVTDTKYFKNATITDAYEPGSVVKSFTIATGLEAGVLNPNTVYKSAPYKVGDHTITTVNNKYYGDQATATKMLEMSDNTGAAQFGLKIGRQAFLESIDKIGLGRVTGVTLQGEVGGYIPLEKDWLPVTLATASFGQGISVTPLQLIQMMSTIANDGIQMKPTILESVDYKGQSTQVEPEQVGRIFSQETAAQTKAMLEGVVKNGEFKRLALQNYGIAGKTSTSQIPIAGGYDKNHTITTFVGFAPANDPKFIMLVKLDKPRVNNSAETVVPVWMNMAKDLFQHYGIGPSPESN